MLKIELSLWCKNFIDILEGLHDPKPVKFKNALTMK